MTSQPWADSRLPIAGKSTGHRIVERALETQETGAQPASVVDRHGPRAFLGPGTLHPDASRPPSASKMRSTRPRSSSHENGLVM